MRYFLAMNFKGLSSTTRKLSPDIKIDKFDKLLSFQSVSNCVVFITNEVFSPRSSFNFTKKVHLLALFSALPLFYVQFSFISDSKQQKPLTPVWRNGVVKAKRIKGFVHILLSPRGFSKKTGIDFRAA